MEEYPTELQPIVAEFIYPIYTFSLTFSQKKEHTDVSIHHTGDDLRCKIFATYKCGKYLDEFEDEFPIQERHPFEGGVTKALFPTDKWQRFWTSANPDPHSAKAPIWTAPKLRDNCARLLQRPSHVEVYRNGNTAKKLLWLHAAVAAQVSSPVKSAA